ncbi:MAG: response regulator transcription factor [Saprospiraceae bacterium]|nr:response regulator transcription factor [Saprospiraceae bacterium]
MRTLKALIVEDEEKSRKTLANMLNNFCEDVTILAECNSVDMAIKEIEKGKPDVVFLDIELPGKNGFELIEHYHDLTFEVVFTTAYNNFAIKAFRLSAIDYLLKPIDLDELRNSLERVREKKSLVKSSKQLSVLKENIQNVFEKITLPTMDGLIFVDLEQIIRCEAQNNYTKFYLLNNENYLVSRTLKYYEGLLNDFNFFRINRTDIINLKYIKMLQKGKKLRIAMSDGAQLNLSDSRKDEFLETIGA